MSDTLNLEIPEKITMVVLIPEGTTKTEFEEIETKLHSNPKGQLFLIMGAKILYRRDVWELVE